MWFRRYLDPFAKAAPAIGVLAMAVMPVIDNLPAELQKVSNIAIVLLAIVGGAIMIARIIWTINKTTLTDGGPGLSRLSDLNRHPIQSKWLGLRGFDLYVTIPLYALLLEFILLFRGEPSDGVRGWFFCNVFFLMAVGNYTRKFELFFANRSR